MPVIKLGFIQFEVLKGVPALFAIRDPMRYLKGRHQRPRILQ